MTFVMIIRAALPISILFGASILTYSSTGQHPRPHVILRLICWVGWFPFSPGDGFPSVCMILMLTEKFMTRAAANGSEWTTWAGISLWKNGWIGMQCLASLYLEIIGTFLEVARECTHTWVLQKLEIWKKTTEYSRDGPCKNCENTTKLLFALCDTVLYWVVNCKVPIKTNKCN